MSNSPHEPPLHPFYEPAVPLRFQIRKRETWEGETRQGRPVAGGRSRKVTETYRILQYWNDDLREWVDVPEVSAHD